MQGQRKSAKWQVSVRKPRVIIYRPAVTGTYRETWTVCSSCAMGVFTWALQTWSGLKLLWHVHTENGLVQTDLHPTHFTFVMSTRKEQLLNDHRTIDNSRTTKTNLHFQKLTPTTGDTKGAKGDKGQKHNHASITYTSPAITDTTTSSP